MRPLNLIFLGTAGAGKSSLTATFGGWIEQHTEQKVAYVNLDPGCEFIPFNPDFDIRKYFTVAKIMEDEKLGPNGAMVRASELFEENAPEFSKNVNALEADVRLVDTPGQLEVFLFHGGREVVSAMNGTTISLFLLDAKLAVDPGGLTFTGLLNLAIGLKLGTPTVAILNKVDLVGDALAKIDGMLSNPEVLKNEVLKEKFGVAADVVLSLADVLHNFLPPARVVKVSAKTGEGLSPLYDVIHEVFCTCGDLT
ncbi:MAG: ATP/GTP-binding protein [Candidatus Hadarchaeales archaeon]